MYIKLTRIDNSPIWINASFVVTVEPRKQGGSIVVPIGDGLDYDVKESPETVLNLLAGAPTPAVVPVPAPKGLTVSSVYGSKEEAPQAEAPQQAPQQVPQQAPQQQAKRPRRHRPRKHTGEPKTGEQKPSEQKPAEPKPSES